MFEQLLYNDMFNFFIQNELISSEQPGFQSRASNIHRFISITQEMYKSLDE